MNDPVRIELVPLNAAFQVERGTPLQDVLFEHGVEFPCGGEGHCLGCRVRVLDGVLPATDEHLRALGEEAVRAGWRLACRCRAEADLRLEISQWEEAILVDHPALSFRPGRGLGIAVDLGTTTLVAQLVDLRTGAVLGVRTGLNPQARHGADIMSRVQFAAGGDGRERLTGLIRGALGGMIGELLSGVRIDPGGPVRVRIVGNTVMHHLFCGLDVEPLSHYPFESEHIGPGRFKGDELGWGGGADLEVAFLPCLGSFVGSDILAGLLAVRLDESPSPAALIDLGTNGEIVVAGAAGMLCASTAAGPAFEGARISRGMRAATGAISQVRLRDGVLECHVLGGVPARGICGSGLVDAAACGLDLGRIQPSGRLTDPRAGLPLIDGIALTQADIRELQLAKGAVAAGLRILLERSGIGMEDLAAVHLAGAFGNYVSRSSARRIGLLECPPAMVRPAGNTALLGAKLALFDDVDEDYAGLRTRVRHVPLGSDLRFQDVFAEAMVFPDGVG